LILKFATGLCLASILACGSSAAYADVNVGQLSCASSTGTNVTADVSYYDLGLTSGTSSQGSGSGAGKVTFNPLEIHTSLDHFTQFLALAVSGQPFSACTLTSQVERVSVTYNLQLLAVSSVDAVAGDRGTSDAARGGYTDVKLSYGALQVQNNNAH
jgi:hypothetical protein